MSGGQIQRGVTLAVSSCPSDHPRSLPTLTCTDKTSVVSVWAVVLASTLVEWDTHSQDTGHISPATTRESVEKIWEKWRNEEMTKRGNHEAIRTLGETRSPRSSRMWRGDPIQLHKVVEDARHSHVVAYTQPSTSPAPDCYPDTIQPQEPR